MKKKVKPKEEPKEKIKIYLIDVMLYTDEEKDKKPYFKKYGRSYWVIAKRDYRQYSVTISRKFPTTLIKQRITDRKPDAREWKEIIRIMLSDTEFKKFYAMVLPY